MRLKDPHAPLLKQIRTLPRPTLVRGPAVRSWSVDAAIYDKTGGVVESATCWHTSTNSAFRDAPDLGAAPSHLPGRWLYGGILYEHFGHVLTESLSRLWALDHVRSVDGIVFFPLLPEDEGAIAKDTLKLFDIDLPLHKVTGHVSVDELILPPQGMGTGDLMGGSPEFREFVRHRLAQRVTPGLPARLYISRSRTRVERGSFLGEHRLEEHLKAEGYTIFHPQEHSLSEQLDHYASANRIVGPDGSPFHLVAYAGHQEQKAAVLKRRPGREWALLAEHLGLFGVGQVVTVKGEGGWSPGGIRRAGLSVTGEISFADIHACLLRHGFIEGTEPWQDLTEAERQEDLLQIAQALDADLYGVRGPGQSLAHLPRRSAPDRNLVFPKGTYAVE